MGARKLVVQETIPASRKLGRDVAAEMLAASTRLIVAKGKKVREWKTGGKVEDEYVAAMLGPTGNLRAPMMRVGKTLLVGFNEEAFEGFFG